MLLWRRHWKRGDTPDVVLHADGERATKSLVRASASDSAEAWSALQSSKSGTSGKLHSGFPRDLCCKQVGSGGGNRLPSSAETSRDRVVDPSRRLADDQAQHWMRWMLTLQEHLWQAI